MNHFLFETLIGIIHIFPIQNWNFNCQFLQIFITCILRNLYLNTVVHIHQYIWVFPTSSTYLYSWVFFTYLFLLLILNLLSDLRLFLFFFQLSPIRFLSFHYLLLLFLHTSLIKLRPSLRPCLAPIVFPLVYHSMFFPSLLLSSIEHVSKVLMDFPLLTMTNTNIIWKYILL